VFLLQENLFLLLSAEERLLSFPVKNDDVWIVALWHGAPLPDDPEN